MNPRKKGSHSFPTLYGLGFLSLSCKARIFFLELGVISGNFYNWWFGFGFEFLVLVDTEKPAKGSVLGILLKKGPARLVSASLT